MNNLYIICKNCKRTFIVPEWEQNLYQQNGRLMPVTCSTCRKEGREFRQSGQKEKFSESDYLYWNSIMTNRIPARRETKHPTDDFRGFISSRKKKAV